MTSPTTLCSQLSPPPSIHTTAYGSVAGGIRPDPLPLEPPRPPRRLARPRRDLDPFTFGSLPFVPLYRTDREAAAELSNKTVHGVAHLAWADLGGGRYEGRMAVYVKPRGAFGRAYMALIKPFRYWVVYPALMRQMERAWDARARGTAPAT